MKIWNTLRLMLVVVVWRGVAIGEILALESPAGTLCFETNRGAIVSLCVKGRTTSVLRSTDEVGLWSWRYSTGSCVFARHFGARSSEKRFSWHWLSSGLEFVYEAPFATVTVRVRPDDHGFLFQSRLETRDSLPAPIEEVWGPARLAFRPKDTEDVVFPMGGNHGLGLALNGSWFTDQSTLPILAQTNTWPRINFYRQWYPATFCDFARITAKDGSACAIYGVQRSLSQEPWKPSRYFVAAGWMAHGGLDVGGISHSFRPWIRAGETWSSPLVRLDLSSTLEVALENYAEANGLGRPIAEKAPAKLIEKLKNAPLIKCGYSAADVRAALPYLPVPSIIHIASYLCGEFDGAYPDHLPPNDRFGTEKEFHDLQVEAQRMGHVVMPYTNPTWWCDNPKGPTFERIGENPLLRMVDGKPHREKYGEKATGFTTTLWHPEVRKANAITMDQFTRLHPVDILFQDQCGCRESFFDFSSFSPKPWAYAEGMVQMVGEDSTKIPLATEGGWDRVAEYETLLCGLGMWIAPMSNEEGPSELRKRWRPDTWRIEPIALRLYHDKCFFTFHDLGHWTLHPRTRAWAIALGYGMSAAVGNGARFAVDSAMQQRIRQLHCVQTSVVSHLATKKLVSFHHDQRQMLCRGLGENTDADDGEVVAQYGMMRVRVNLGNVPRMVDGVWLGPYGYRIDGPDVAVSDVDVKGRK